MTDWEMNRNEARERVVSIPLIQTGDMVDKPLASVIYLDIERTNQLLYRHLDTQISVVQDEIAPELSYSDDQKCFLVSPADLTSIIARAMIRGAAQTVSDIGESIKDRKALEEWLNPPME